MEISIPIYVNHHRDGGVDRISIEALDHRQHRAGGADLNRTLKKFANQLREHLGMLGRGTDHQPLADWHRDDDLEHQVVKLELNLRDATAKIRILLVIQKLNDGRRLIYSPNVAGQWFDCQESESVKTRATEFYEDHFRQLRNETPGYTVESVSIQGKAWIDWLLLDIPIHLTPKKKADPIAAFLGGEDVSDGAAELRKVGRCLNHVDPHDLADPIGVEEDLSRLQTLLRVTDRRGVVLVGPLGSGKTARIEGVVRTMPAKRSKRLTWHLSPARLISGMSYLGQWQQRVLAIMKHAHRYDHILYFDDLLGLLEAGKTRDSSMCVADMMRTQLETHPVRILAEMTTDAWAIFRRRDPKLAAGLVVMPVGSMNVSTTTELMIRVRQQLEARHRCSIDFPAIPEWVSLQDRFDSSSALPGKAIRAMQSLATKMPHQFISRNDVLEEFCNRTGLRRSVIDQQQLVTRDQLHDKIREQVIGQDEAVNTLLDRAMVAITRMNDRSRPLGTYLLVGPTGVGKTELAKAIASCLFDDGGLIRLDMNELSAPGSASRLIGTFDAPDGLLTAAVRRRPHAVLLLDEIEKAHPSVLDVLLPALGEARLSDARGRSVDLSGLLILMTSNLGTRDSVRSTGFIADPDQQEVRQRHLKAVREYFRPEFFNRIDDILHFERLSPKSIEKIAGLQFRRLLKRDGLQRRNVLIDIAPETLRQTAIRGVDSRMGARSLKRQIERDLIRPAAETLAAHPAGTSVLLRLAPSEQASQQTRDQDQGQEPCVAIACIPIQFVKRADPVERTVQQWIELASVLLQRAEAKSDLGPLSFETGAALETGQLEDLVIRETCAEIKVLMQTLVDLQENLLTHPPAMHTRQPGGPPSRNKPMAVDNPKSHRQDFTAFREIQEYWAERLTDSAPGDVEEQIRRLRIELGRLQSQLDHLHQPSRWQVSLRWFGAEPDASDLSVRQRMQRIQLEREIQNWFESEESLAVQTIEDQIDRHRVMVVEGALAAASVAEMVGGWMIVDVRLQTCIFEVSAHPIDHDSPEEVTSDNDFRWDHLPPIRRILHARDGSLDLLAGYRTSAPSRGMELMDFFNQTYFWSSAKYPNSDAVDSAGTSSPGNGDPNR